jgi:glycosyltransferase involved in cell wall biosynthesis
VPTITAVILTLDEADRIAACLKSVNFCDEVLVLDAGSTDGTAELARSLGATVAQTDWPGFVAQKNRGLDLARGDWVLSVDADERLDDELAAAVRRAVAEGTCEGYWMNRRNFWLGHRLRGGMAWPDARIRLVRRGHGRWQGRDPHDVLVVDGATGALPGELLHDSYRSLADHLARIERYSRIDARAGTWLDILVRPVWHLVAGFVFRRGFLDGWAGFAYATLGAFYVFLKWGRRRFEASQ